MTKCKTANVNDVVADREAFNKLTTEKPWLDIVSLNSRGKTNKRKVTTDKNEQVVTTVVESKLSDETIAYEKQKEELLGKEVVAGIKKQVWDEEEDYTTPNEVTEL